MDRWVVGPNLSPRRRKLVLRLVAVVGAFLIIGGYIEISNGLQKWLDGPSEFIETVYPFGESSRLVGLSGNQNYTRYLDIPNVTSSGFVHQQGIHLQVNATGFGEVLILRLPDSNLADSVAVLNISSRTSDLLIDLGSGTYAYSFINTT